MFTPATGYSKAVSAYQGKAPVPRRLVFVGTNGPHPGLIYSSSWRRVMPPGPADFILLTLEPMVLHDKRVQGGSTGRLLPATLLG
jgi:hypothetical protein